MVTINDRGMKHPLNPRRTLFAAPSRVSIISLLALVALFYLVHAHTFPEAQQEVLTTRTGHDGPSQPVSNESIPGLGIITYKKTQLCNGDDAPFSIAGFLSPSAYPETSIFFQFVAKSSPQQPRDPSQINGPLETPAEGSPLTLWLQGGPAADSLIGFYAENGPCVVTPDLKAVQNNDSWHLHSDMLYISQPVGVGFSNQGAKEGCWNNTAGHIEDGVGRETCKASKMRWGQWPVVKMSNGDSDSAMAVVSDALDLFAAWLDKSKVASPGQPRGQARELILAGESYAGHYIPALAHRLLQHGSDLFKLTSILLVSPLIDMKIQYASYADFAENNTYAPVLSRDQINATANAYITCASLLSSCETVQSTPKECEEAFDFCRDEVRGIYVGKSGRNEYDIRQPTTRIFPKYYFPAYLNQGDVQDALGVHTNYSGVMNNGIAGSFADDGDPAAGTFIEQLSEALDRGVRVLLVHGDADWTCNWFGGEAISLSLEWEGKRHFHESGYEEIDVDGIWKGDVREYSRGPGKGSLGFARIFRAGHMVSAFQSRAMAAAFARIASGLDIAAGTRRLVEGYSTVGNQASKYREGEAEKDWQGCKPEMLGCFD